MISGIKLTLIAAAGAGLIGSVAGWKANGMIMQSRIDGMVARHSEALAKANADALAKYTAMEKRKQEAVDEANRIAQTNARAAAAARADADRLRDSLTTASAGVSTATVTSLRNYTTTVNSVFAECVQEIEGLAKEADGHALDSRTLMGAWPK